jgi:hypothetical protein
MNFEYRRPGKAASHAMRAALWSALFRCSLERARTARTNGAGANLNLGSAKMTSSMEIQLIRIIANLALYLEFSSSTRDEDSEVSVMEQLASELQGMSEEDQRKFSDTIRAIGPDYDKKQREFLTEFPENFGLEGS